MKSINVEYPPISTMQYDNMERIPNICRDYINGVIDEKNEIGQIIEDLEWSDEIFDKLVEILVVSQKEIRKYLLIRTCHIFFKLFIQKNWTFDHVPIGLKKMFLLCGGDNKSKYDITNLIGLGMFLGKAITFGESRFVMTILFNPHYNYIEHISEVDMEYICNDVYHILINYKSRLKNCFRFPEDDESKFKEQNVMDFYQLAYALVTSKQMFNMKWITHIEYKRCLKQNYSNASFADPCNTAKTYKCVGLNWETHVSVLCDIIELKLLVHDGDKPREINKYGLTYFNSPNLVVDFSKETKTKLPSRYVLSSKVADWRSKWRQYHAVFEDDKLCFGNRVLIRQDKYPLFGEIVCELKSFYPKHITVMEPFDSRRVLFCLTELYTNSYICISDQENKLSSFFKITSQLPLELRMRIVNITFNKNELFIDTTNLIEDASIELFLMS